MKFHTYHQRSNSTNKLYEQNQLIFTIIFCIFFLPQILVAIDTCHEETGWCFEQSTIQDFYMFDDIRIDEVIVDYSGVISDGEDGFLCPASDCDVIGAFIDSVCVGWVYPYPGGGVFTVIVMGDDGIEGTGGYAVEGDIPTFKIWDDYQEVIIDAIPKNYGEPFTDENGNCVWDDGEDFVDSNGNGFWEGPSPIPGFQPNHTPSADEIIDILNAYYATPTDCNGDAGGTAFIDDCGYCAGGLTCNDGNDISVCDGPDIDCNCDCKDYTNPENIAFFDDCGQCVGGGTDEDTPVLDSPGGWEGDCHLYDELSGQCQENWALDCYDVCFGGNQWDEFEYCCDPGEMTTWFEDSDHDLLGNPDIQFEVCYPDSVSDIVNNNYDEYPDCQSNSVDDCGVCDGFNSDIDCADECFGTAEEDLCGVCDDDPGNDNVTCTGCTDSDALNCEDEVASNFCESCESGIPCSGYYNPEALFYDGSCIYIVYPGDTDANGRVDGYDIIPIGVFWGEFGSPRTGYNYSWEDPQFGYDNWSSKWAMFADANGDGEINIFDVQLVFINYGLELNSDSYDMSSGSFYDDLDLELYRASFEQIYNGLPPDNYQNPIKVLLEEIFGFESLTYIPMDFQLHQNRPNPFNPVTSIIYEIPTPSDINLTITNLLGETIINYFNSIGEPGVYEYELNGTELPSGIYFYHLTSTTGISISKKMMLLK